MDTTTVGQNIRKNRKLKGFTQEDLANLANLSTMSIRRYESGERTPTLDVIHRIASALNITASRLLPADNYWKDENGQIHQVPIVPTESELNKRLRDSYSSLTLEGKGKAAEAVEVIAGNPRYRAETAPQSTPPPQEGKDTTTPPPDAPETAPEGK